MGIASALGNIGIVHSLQGNYSQALQYFQESLKLAEKSSYKQMATNALGNIGCIYYSQGNCSQALEYFHKSLKLAEGLGDKGGISAYRLDFSASFRLS